MAVDFDKLFIDISKMKVAVIGDIMLDTYWWGNVDRISPEAPVPVVVVSKREKRIGGAGNVALNVQALGASVQSINFGELYTALQQGVVDGQENPPTTIRVQKYFEVQKYFSLTRHIASFAFAVMNKGVFDRQPENIRQAIDEAGKTATEKGRDFLVKDEDASLDFLRKQGMVINEPQDISGFRDAARPVIDDAGPVLAPLVKEILAAG